MKGTDLGSTDSSSHMRIQRCPHSAANTGIFLQAGEDDRDAAAVLPNLVYPL